MFCEKCGTKNKKGTKFCENCGHKFEIVEETEDDVEETKTVKPAKPKKAMPKKKKILLGIVAVVIVGGCIALYILLNNPLKVVEDNIASYYSTYEVGEESSLKELKEIKKVIKDNKKNDETLDKIKDTITKAIDSWVKNFNVEYKNEDKLEDAYEKLTEAIKDIYNYDDDYSEYMIDKKHYQEIMYDLAELRESKLNYLEGMSSKGSSRYGYLSKVIKEDSYYKKAQDEMNSYIKEELESYLSKANSYIDLAEGATNEELLEGYIEQIDYLKDNTYLNGIDITKTEDYTKLYDAAISKLMELVKTVIAEKEAAFDYKGALDIIEDAMDPFYSDEAEYKALQELKEEENKKMPDELIDKYVVEYHYGWDSDYYYKEDGKSKASVYFEFAGETAYRTYRLNNEYKKLRAKLVVGPDWPSNFSGTIVISANGKELYNSGKITKTTEFNPNIEIDVTNVDDLKIEFVTTDKPTGWDDFYIYLVEPYLYK